jgi:CubicO group peptidase (beta-lactamase class C family)
MNPDELKKMWQTQTSPGRLTIDADVLLRQLERNKQHFEALIFWRDTREVGVALLLVPVILWMGVKGPFPWTFFLTIPAMLWVAGFMLADRLLQKRRQPRPGDPLRDCLERSLAQVEHQIWLLRNMFWWYLLPPGAAMAAFFGHLSWLTWAGGWPARLIMAGVIAVITLVLWGVYRLNQNCVRKELEPRRDELSALIANLEGANPGGLPSGEITGGAPPARTKAGWRLWLWIICIGVILSFLWTVAQFFHHPGDMKAALSNTNAAAADANYCPAAGDAAVTNLLVPIRQKFHVPAIAAALVTSKGLRSVGVVGTRKQGTDIAPTLEDKWHLGSDTKAMTATLVAKLVEEGRLKWDTTLAEVFPELAARFNPEVRTITVLQLLTHFSGLPANPDLMRYGGAEGRRERLRILENELNEPPPHKPGTHREYSNLGYTIAGAITEKITGKSWEEAMREKVFGPLGMTSVGFGGTGTPGRIDQPWGHRADGQPVGGNGPAMDNPPVLGPAGRVHCTIQDWARFITDQLRGDRGEPALLKPETYRFLHTPPLGSDYALGWIVVERDWAGGVALNHGGDNTMNFANVWMAPRRDFAILVCVNQSGETGFKASDEAVGALIKLLAERRTESEAKSN